jgi:hypothetical protein
MSQTRRKPQKRSRVRTTHKRSPLFFFHPDQPDKRFDVYINKNPKDTIPIRYKTIEDVQHTITHLEKLYKTKQYPHQRIWQVGMILYVRLRALQRKKPKEYALAKRYFTFLGHRTSLSQPERYRARFSF